MTDTAFTASQLVTAMRAHNVEPDYSFDAAAGRDYGYVRAWSVDADETSFVIQYGDNGGTSYDTAENVDDLAAWLEYDNVDGPDRLRMIANVRGEDAIDAAEETEAGPVLVLITRFWYGSTETSDFAETDDNMRTPREFETYQDAQDWIDAAEEGIYSLSHNESGAPSYKIVTE